MLDSRFLLLSFYLFSSLANGTEDVDTYESGESDLGLDDYRYQYYDDIHKISETDDFHRSSIVPPSTVSLHYNYNDEFICGGSIITSKIVLTAAHCMYYPWGGLLPPLIITVSAGKNNLNDTSTNNFAVASVTLHPNFNKTTMENDLALVEVSSAFPSNNVIGKVTLEKNIPEAQYNNCFVTGWDKETSNFEVTEVIMTDCSSSPNHICTKKKFENESICISDAGNPLLCDNKLIGVLSVEPLCESPSEITIFEDITKSVHWLTEFGIFNSSASNNYNFYLPIVIFPTILIVGNL